MARLSQPRHPARRSPSACSPVVQEGTAPVDCPLHDRRAGTRRHRPHPRRGGAQRPRAAAGARSAARVPRRRTGSTRRTTSRRVADRRRTLERHVRAVDRRRPAPSPARAAAAERARRAARGAAAARARATPVRVPRVLAVCDDESVIGAPFYVMERGPGRRDHGLDARAARHARRARPHGRRRADRLARRAALGRLDVRSGWRASASRPATWSASCGASPDCGSTTARASSREVEEVGSWLAANMPELAAGDDRPRRLPAGQHDVRLRQPGASWSRSSTGRWRRSATRSPMSAT